MEGARDGGPKGRLFVLTPAAAPCQGRYPLSGAHRKGSSFFSRAFRVRSGT